LVKSDQGSSTRYRAIAEESVSAPRLPALVQRIVRNSELAQRVKVLHGYTCQVCGIQIDTPAGYYAEAAHIRPLGEPHNGPDELGNLLCLCPNDHVRFDLGSIILTDDLNVIAATSGAILGTLRTNPAHRPSREHLAFHRRLWMDEPE
jgi:putative restriction endonuclease